MLDCLSQSSCSDRVMEGRVSAGVRPKSVLKGTHETAPPTQSPAIETAAERAKERF